MTFLAKCMENQGPIENLQVFPPPSPPPFPPTAKFPAPLHSTGNRRPVTDECILDFGASSHMLPTERAFFRQGRTPGNSIRLGDSKVIRGQFRGRALVTIDNKPAVLDQALYVPALRTALISVGRLAVNRQTVTFSDDHAHIYDRIASRHMARFHIHNYLFYANITYENGSIISRAHERYHDYLLQVRETFDVQVPMDMDDQIEDKHRRLTRRQMVGTADELHQRLPHVGIGKLLRLHAAGAIRIRGPKELREPCRACVAGNLRRRPAPSQASQATAPGQITVMDVCGPVPRAHDDSCYYLLIIDVYSRFVMPFPIATKDQVPACFAQYRRFMEVTCGFRMSVVHSDQGTEFNAIRRHNQDLTHTRSSVNAPNENGIAERYMGLSQASIRISLESGIPRRFWTAGLQHWANVSNHLIRANGQSALAMLNQPTFIHELHPVGTRCYYYASKYTKLSPRAAPSIYLCYKNGLHRIPSAIARGFWGMGGSGGEGGD